MLSELGNVLFLSSKLTLRPRYKHDLKRTQDVMAFVRYFGLPDLFINFKCNPKWPKILVVLKKGQKSQDQHHIVA